MNDDEIWRVLSHGEFKNFTTNLVKWMGNVLFINHKDWLPNIESALIFGINSTESCIEISLTYDSILIFNNLFETYIVYSWENLTFNFLVFIFPTVLVLFLYENQLSKTSQCVPFSLNFFLYEVMQNWHEFYLNIW